MDTLRAMRFFVRTVEVGSLSAVAREQGTTQPTVSKVLTALEESLNVRLLERSTKGPVPTEQGLRFYEDAKGILEEFDAAAAAVRSLTEKPTGLLRINAPVALGQFRLNALLQDYLRMYPGISVELILNDRFVDLVEEGVDVALRLGASLPPNAIARRIAVVPRFFVASPEYLAQRGNPERPADLGRHDYVRFAWAASGNVVDLHRPGESLQVEMASRYRVNNAIAIRETLALGGGIGLCPEWLVHDLLAEGKLLRVLPEWSATAQDLYLIYPSRRYQPLRMRLFMAFIADRICSLPGFEKPQPDEPR